MFTVGSSDVKRKNAHLTYVSSLALFPRHLSRWLVVKHFALSSHKATTDRLLKIVGVLGVAILAIIVRTLQIYPFETNGDSIIYWISAEHLLSGLSSELPTWDFRLARLGILLPAAATKLLTGNSFWGYHITPIVASTLCAVLVYRMGAQLSSPEIGFFGAFLFLIFPPVVQNSVQLLPGIFEAVYLLASVFSLILYIEQSKRFFLVVAAGCLFLAYLTKFSALLCLPGFLIVLWRERADFPSVMAFIGTLAVLYVFEHGYMQLLGYEWGRFEMLFERAATKTSGGSGTAVYSLADFLIRWDGKHIGRFWVDIRTVAVPAILLTLLWGNSRVRAILIILSSHILLTTFALRSLDPPILMTNLQSRYLTIYSPLVVLLIVLSYHTLIQKFLASNTNETLDKRFSGLPLKVFIFLLFFVLLSFTDSYYLIAYGSIAVLLVLTIYIQLPGWAAAKADFPQTTNEGTNIMRGYSLIFVMMVAYPLLKMWLPGFVSEMKNEVYQIHHQTHSINLIKRYQTQFDDFYRSNRLIIVEEYPGSRNSGRIKGLGISAIYLGALGTPLKWHQFPPTTGLAGADETLGYAAIVLSQKQSLSWNRNADVLFVPKDPWEFVQPRISRLGNLIGD